MVAGGVHGRGVGACVAGGGDCMVEGGSCTAEVEFEFST